MPSFLATLLLCLLVITTISTATATSLHFTSCAHALPLNPQTTFSWSVDPIANHTSFLAYRICSPQPDTLRFVKALRISFKSQGFLVEKLYTLCEAHSTACYDQLAQSRCLAGRVRVLAPVHQPLHTYHEITVLERADRAVLHASDSLLYPTNYLSPCSPTLLPTQNELCVRSCAYTDQCARGQVCDTQAQICTCTAFSGCGDGYACYTNNSTDTKQGLGRCYCDVTLVPNTYACNAANAGGTCKVGSYSTGLSIDQTPVFTHVGEVVKDNAGNSLTLDPGDSLRGKILFKKLTQTTQTLTQTSLAQELPGFCVCNVNFNGPNCDNVFDTTVSECGTHGRKYCSVDPKLDRLSQPHIKLVGDGNYAVCDLSETCSLQLCNQAAATAQCVCEPFWLKDNTGRCELEDVKRRYCSNHGTYSLATEPKCTCDGGWYDTDCSQTAAQFCNGANPMYARYGPQRCDLCADGWGPAYSATTTVGPFCNLRYGLGSGASECNGQGYARDFHIAEALLYLPTGELLDRFATAATLSQRPFTLAALLSLTGYSANSLPENYALLRAWWHGSHGNCTCFPTDPVLPSFPQTATGSCGLQRCEPWLTRHVSDDPIHSQPNGQLCGGLLRGVCFDATCVCRDGFTGPDCGQVQCLHARGAVCAGNGVCDTETNLCVCQQHFYGLACEFRDAETRIRGQALQSNPPASVYAFTQIIEEKIL